MTVVLFTSIGFCNMGSFCSFVVSIKNQEISFLKAKSKSGTPFAHVESLWNFGDHIFLRNKATTFN